MKRLLIFVLVLMLCSVAYSTKIHSTAEDRLGAFSGDGGAAQDDSALASLNLAHTDLDVMIAADNNVMGLLGLGTGNIYYVDSAQSGTNGLTWADALATIDAAIGKCTADAGDIILVAPGHTETLAASGMIFDADAAGITIIGLGNGELRPILNLNHADANTAIGADDVTIRNIHFFSMITACKAAIIVEVGDENFVIEDCVFDTETPGTDEFVDAVIVSGTASDGGIIRNNLFDMGATANADTQSAINFIDCDNLQIYGNRIFGDYAVACIQNETTASNLVVIRDNILFNGIIGGTTGLNTLPCITLLATTTGMVINNACFTNVATPDLAIKGDDVMMSGNTYCEAEGRVGSEPIRHLTGTLRTVTKATIFTGTTDDMFDVAGGAIEIVSMFGQCTTAMETPGKLTIEWDADAGTDYDSDFSTDVDINSVGAGDTVCFTNAISEGTTTTTANVGAGQTLSWFCGEGVIEQTTGQTAASGAMKWYMTYRALDPNVTVTPQ